MDLGSRIRQIRTKKGISQRFIQKKLNKYGSWLSQVESGDVQIYAKDIPGIAEALGVDLVDLFSLELCSDK